MTWVAPDPGEVSGPLTGADRPMITAYLGWQRSTLLRVCAGLTAAQLAHRPLPSSNLSLLGLVRHMAKVERTWFRIRMASQPIEPLYDLELGKDYDFDVLDPADAEPALARLVEEVRLADEAVAELSFDDTIVVHGDDMSLRMIYLHMCGEYARHNGHADLLREAIDGVTGR